MNRLAQRIARVIRENVADEEQCEALAAESDEACLAVHPIHLASSTDGVVYSIYADIDGLAKIIAHEIAVGLDLD